MWEKKQKTTCFHTCNDDGNGNGNNNGDNKNDNDVIDNDDNYCNSDEHNGLISRIKK